ncbi:MAG: homocysteine S-methyltransferase family protein [Candidatus Aminicenantes bacterium]|nr:homocysteine S-methyltransferase family protein [Candidatus Aminicenantes bacterium]
MKLIHILKERVLILDGGMGTEILKHTGNSFELPEVLNVDLPGVIEEIHAAYINAGADIIETNTLGANRIRLGEFGMEDRVEEFNMAGARIAVKARGGRPVFVAGSMGPLGTLLYPLGDITVEEAHQIFAEQARALENGGVDFLLIETQIDVLEAKTALRAAREATSIPIAVSMTFPQEDGRTVAGSNPETSALIFATPDTDFYGINCGGHPDRFSRYLEDTLRHNHKPLLVYANAGDPQKFGDTTIFPLGPEEYLPHAVRFYEQGASIIGGCCGTTPDHIRLIARELKNKKPVPYKSRKSGFRSASRSTVLYIGSHLPFRTIGENINPFARKELSTDLKSGSLDVALRYARLQDRAGADALDINLGKKAEKDPHFYGESVARIQQSSNLPFFLDNRNPESLEQALRVYAGKAVINSVSAEQSSMDVLFPLAKKYGAGVLLLAMDEHGIPETVEARTALLRELYEAAMAFGLNPDDCLVDPVVHALSASPDQAAVTLGSIQQLRALSLPTTLGLSNISYGLPRRKFINSGFLNVAIEKGLNSAILNPLDDHLMGAARAVDALANTDVSLKLYIETFAESAAEKIQPEQGEDNPEHDLFQAVLDGESSRVNSLIDRLIESGKDGFTILETILAPALAKAGEYYEQNIYFLPQLILTAKAMECSSEHLTKAFPREEKAPSRARLLLATVKGDIHDIGKNIVRLVLRNSGFEVIDLGKNADAMTIIDKALENDVSVIGLSSLMTTTLDEMLTVVRLRNTRAPGIKIILGGAAVSEEYAEEIGADAFGKDAMDAVRQVKKLLGDEQ